MRRGPRCHNRDPGPIKGEISHGKVFFGDNISVTGKKKVKT